MADYQEWHAVRPEGLAARILSVTIGFTVACLVVVGLRVWLRLKLSTFGTEDYLMCAGVTLNMVHNAVVMYGTFTGIGSPDSKLNTAIMIEGAKAIVLWQIFYVSGSLFIKASICATLVRIATRRRFICTLCKPVAASWDPSLGSCLDRTIIITLTASTATIIRMPYSSAYSNPVDLLLDNRMADNVGNIILWTIVECGMGIIAGSLPMLRQLFKGLAKELSNKDDTYALRARSGTMVLGHGRSRSDRESPPDTETDSTHGIIKTTSIDVTAASMQSSARTRDDSMGAGGSMA
ncbi:hypothetical protein CNYM01_04176 [Colletotrichum nymphaeae SA-01]|uniref:Rhodopsin domain-containing protein n=1 Tax=Colletotrichum nymphaeae SA-01 TaxID=1460502 RepID=A0A135S2V0_9PEZI|nr:hypothetical protein CNYM01_04176 [Colletotrichum nymphaeae SA-01]